MSKPKRLFFDLETCPNVGLFWDSGYQINVPYENIIKERAIICVAWKWAREKRVNVLTWDNNQDDKTLVKEFIPILNEADEIVAHNGIDFDIKWLRGRAIKHGIPMVPDYTIVDTLKIARSRFKFNSNALDYISQYLGLGSKIKTDYSLWKEVLLNNNKTALKKMVQYCKHDVELLEQVWDKMNPYVLARSNFAEYTHQCPECNSPTRKRKTRITAGGYRKVQFQCIKCGKYGSIAESRFMNKKKI